MIVSVTLDLLRGGSEIEIGPLQLSGIVAGIALIFAAMILQWPSIPSILLRISIRGLILALFIIGMVLLTINMAGVFQSLRNPIVYDGIRYHGVMRAAKYTPGEVYEEMDMKPNENRKDYAKRLTQLIYDGVLHYWRYEGAEEYNLQVPLTENFLLYLNGLETPLHPIRYQFCDARRAIDRGVGICSQYAQILVDVMTSNGIPAKVMGLSGHVVAMVQVDEVKDTWWILDADFGVVIESNLTEIEADRYLAWEKYSETAYNLEAMELIMSIYGPEGNNEIDTVDYCKTEERLYQLKWLIPLATILPFSATIGYSAYRRKLEQNRDEQKKPIK